MVNHTTANFAPKSFSNTLQFEKSRFKVSASALHFRTTEPPLKEGWYLTQGCVAAPHGLIPGHSTFPSCIDGQPVVETKGNRLHSILYTVHISYTLILQKFLYIVM